jgi:hypothetical protein
LTRVTLRPLCDLLRRVFVDDILHCSCGGRRSVIAIITEPMIARTLLAALDLPDEPAPAHDPPKVEIEIAQDEPA